MGLVWKKIDLNGEPTVIRKIQLQAVETLKDSNNLEVYLNNYVSDYKSLTVDDIIVQVRNIFTDSANSGSTSITYTYTPSTGKLTITGSKPIWTNVVAYNRITIYLVKDCIIETI